MTESYQNFDDSKPSAEDWVKVQNYFEAITKLKYGLEFSVFVSEDFDQFETALEYWNYDYSTVIKEFLNEQAYRMALIEGAYEGLYYDFIQNKINSYNSYLISKSNT